MNLRNRIAFYFVSRLFWLILIWGIFIVISISLFNFFLGHDRSVTPKLSADQIVAYTTIQNNQIAVRDEIKADLKKNDMWLQILDESGNETFSFNKPDTVQEHYIPGELVSDYIYPANTGYQLSTWYETVNEQDLTWVIGKPKTANNPLLYWANNLWILSIIVIGILIALFFGKQLGAPLLYVVSWIENLSKGKYEEPSDLKRYSKKRRQNKRKNKVYQDLMLALSKLTSALKQGETEREQLEKTREEWMTGVSHDLKTPLSTIKGYTALLASDSYHWQEAEVRHFAKTMEERVTYMEQLIADFNLTFQLKNSALPIHLEQVNLVDYIKMNLEQMKQLPEASQDIFSFETNKEQILLEIDTKYLKRAFENLIANSIKHNPPQTKINIILHEEAKNIHITIQDNGVGMDQETVDLLFDQYFRGTNASSDNAGTGLGMAIAKQIILAHQGDIRIKSKLKIGTQYHIILPRKSSD